MTPRLSDIDFLRVAWQNADHRAVEQRFGVTYDGPIEARRIRPWIEMQLEILSCYGCRAYGVNGCINHSPHWRALLTMRLVDLLGVPVPTAVDPVRSPRVFSPVAPPPAPVAGRCRECDADAVFDSGLCHHHEHERCVASFSAPVAVPA